MAENAEALRVTLASNGFWPQVFRWRGCTVRVLAVENIQTRGTEQCYRVRTNHGDFDLGLSMERGTWRVRRDPTWFSRLQVRWDNAPRYPLPVWRRRARATVSAKRLAPAFGVVFPGRARAESTRFHPVPN